MNWNFLTRTLTVAGLLTGLVSAATPNFPFPQSKQYAQGSLANTALASKVKEKFLTWKQNFYVEGTVSGTGTARIKFEPTGETVSEGIAYGMLNFVYMSSTAANYQNEFDKLWAYWKCFNTSGTGCSNWSGQGMNWHINGFSSVMGSGSASDAELDAAMALIMADKQWGSTGTVNYLSDAKKLITWIRTNEISSEKFLNPGSNWGDKFNPSYLSMAAFELFKTVDDASDKATFWQAVIDKNYTLLAASQNATSGLVPDWVNESGVAQEPNVAVGQGEIGFFDDATRTPWRMAMAYYWFGHAKAKAFNDKIFAWLYPSSYGNASYIYSGFELNGKVVRDFTSSSFIGGLGLAAATTSATRNTDYMNTIYVALANKSSEKYYPSTLNVLYLLLASGNMPNLAATGLTAFTAQSAKTVEMPTGAIQAEGVPVAGFTVWGTFGDKLGTGTAIKPDSGTYPVFREGTTDYAKLNCTLGPEPLYVPDVELDYPYAGMIAAFDSKDSYVDLTKMTKIRLTYKSEGVFRIALLSKDRDSSGNEGSEFGYFLMPTEGVYKTITISTIPDVKVNYTLGDMVQPAWSSKDDPTEVLPAVRGIKFEPKMPDGGYGSISIQNVELLDASGNSVAPKTSSATYDLRRNAQVHVGQQGENLLFSGFSSDVWIVAYALDGREISRVYPGRSSGSVALKDLGLIQGLGLVHVSDGNLQRVLNIAR